MKLRLDYKNAYFGESGHVMDVEARTESKRRHIAFDKHGCQPMRGRERGETIRRPMDHECPAEIAALIYQMLEDQEVKAVPGHWVNDTIIEYEFQRRRTMMG